MTEKVETITRWRDNQRVIEADNSQGLGVLPSNVVARIKADSFNEVLRLFKGDIE